MALKNDGTVWVGEYIYLSESDDNNSNPNSTTFVQVSDLSDVITLSAGTLHNMVLKRDNTVWAWGCNDFGALGDGTTTYLNSPVQVFDIGDVTAIASGGSTYSLVLRSDGTVWACDRSVPVQVSGLSDVIAIATASFHSLVLRGDGSVWAWGRNDDGALGDGSNLSSDSPVQVLGLFLPMPSVPAATSTWFLGEGWGGGLLWVLLVLVVGFGVGLVVVFLCIRRRSNGSVNAQSVTV